MAKEKIKVGDLVETCSLIPGVVMTSDGDDEITVRQIDVEDYGTGGFGSHSVGRCGVVKLTPTQAIKRLLLGKDKLAEFYKLTGDIATSQKSHQEDYSKMVDEYNPAAPYST